MIETILHTVPYAVGVCVCGGLAAHAALKGLGRLNGYSIGISIEPLYTDLEKALDREYRIPRLRSGDERRAARALAEARSRARTRSYLREAKKLDSEAKRQFEDAAAKHDAALYVKQTQNLRRAVDAKMHEAVRIAQERRKYQEARVEELDAIRAERKAAKAAEEEQRERKEQAAGRKVRRAVDIPLWAAEEMLRDEQEETGGAEPASILDAASRISEETEEGNFSADRLVSG